MQWVGRALSSVSQYYKEINPATLSGAIDVIVVEHEDPKDGTISLACSPFHVRFGKLSVLRPVDRTVHVKVNDTDAPYQMKVGDTGEAFFVFETDQDVPADMQTSPLTGPLLDEEADGEPDHLELGDSVASLAGNKSNGQDTSLQADQEHKQNLSGKHVSTTSRLLEGAATRVQEAGRGVITSTLVHDKLGGMGSKVAASIPSHGDKDNKSHLNDAVRLQKEHAVTEEAFVASEFAVRPTSQAGNDTAIAFGSAPDTSDAPAKETVASTGEQTEPPSHDHSDNVAPASAHGKEQTGSSYASADTSTQSTFAHSGVQHELMLDMAGYKTNAGDEADPDGLKTPTMLDLGTPIHNGSSSQDEVGHDKLAELHERDPDVFALTRALLRYSESKETQHAGHERRQSLHPAASDPTMASSDLTKAASDPYMFVLVSEGHPYIFEIALCKNFASSQAHSMPSSSEFEANRMTSEHFLKHPETLQDTRLFVRFRSRYFGWDNGHPVLATLELYRKALIESQPKPAAPVSKGTWSRWWSRKDTRARTSTEESDTIAPSDASVSSHDKQPGPPSSDLAASDLGRSRTEPLKAHASSHPDSPDGSKLSPDLAQAESVVAAPTDLIDAPTSTKQYAKTLRLTSDQLKALNLQKGANTVSFTVQSSYSGVAMITARIFLWQSDIQAVISDIDGTITKSDALGHVFTMIGRDWTHPGVAKLYTDIARNGYKMMYLTSRAVGQADITREYLRGVQQNGFTLPDGPVIMSPDRLLTSLHREVVLRKPEVFKMGCLRDIKRLFVDRNPFYAGFGNRLTDGLSYRHVEIPSSKIFTIDSYGNVKLELLELAGYSSTYIAMANLVNETFPPVTSSSQPAFNDFNYWRAALPEVDLPDLTPEPVSPALSARSESSRMSVFRVAGLAGALSKRASRSQIKPAVPGDADGTLSPLSASPRSTSPSPLQTVYSAQDDSKPRRRRHADSMPGSFEEHSPLEAMRESLELERDEGQAAAELLESNDDEQDELLSDEEEEADETLDDDDLPEIDFDSVPYL